MENISTQGSRDGSWNKLFNMKILSLLNKKYAFGMNYFSQFSYQPYRVITVILPVS